MFVDTAKVSLKAGKGGDGAVSFRHEIYIPKGGPDGGDGGKGGDIIFRADKDTNTLIDFRFTPILTAENGKNGSGQRAAGRSGKDLIVEVPIGTCVYRLEETQVADNVFSGNNSRFSRSETYIPDGAEKAAHRADFPGRPAYDVEGEKVRSQKDVSARTRVLLADLTEDGQEVIIAKGGDGGFGNAHFKSSVRQAPRIAEVGEPGEEFEAELELKSMADVGLVGLPNAGKSTFLSVVSNAKPEIADYPFTTITPNLGVATIDDRDLLIADIPGLIEGASEGKGLGHDFLRHVDRTAVLLHLVDVYNNDAGAAYQTIRTELDKYSDLKDRPEIVALTKCEGVDDDIIKMQMASILEKNPDAKVYAISSAAHQGITELLRALSMRVQSSTREYDDTTRSQDVPSKHPGHEEYPHSRSINADGAFTERPSPVIDSSRKRAKNVLAHSSELTMSGRPEGSTGARERSENDGYSRDSHATSTLQNGISDRSDLPTISLSPNVMKDTWQVEKLDDGRFRVTGEKIEKFARRTDMANYASVNRLRDIMKKLGIRAELTTQGAQPDSIIEISGKEFPLVEDW